MNININTNGNNAYCQSAEVTVNRCKSSHFGVLEFKGKGINYPGDPRQATIYFYSTTEVEELIQNLNKMKAEMILKQLAEAKTAIGKAKAKAAA